MTSLRALEGKSWQGDTDGAQVWALLREHKVSAPRRLHLWISEGTAGRQVLEKQLRRRWPECEVQVYSCYKPLVNALLPLLPAWKRQPPKRLHLRYPVLGHGHPERFLLEAYPLAGWAQQLGFAFSSEADCSGAAFYTVTVDDAEFQVPVPVRQAQAVTGELVQRMTGRLLIDDAPPHDFLTAPEQLWNRLLEWFKQQAWSAEPPYLSTLKITAQFPFEREDLAYGHEALDLGEALSEDFYFGVQEFFQLRAGEEPGNRAVQTGWIVPVVTAAPQKVSLDISCQWAGPPMTTPATLLPELQGLDRPLTPEEALGWQRTFINADNQNYYSARGRPVTVFSGPESSETMSSSGGLLVTAGQHANESTGVVAALRYLQENRAAEPLRVIPLENPDGYALFNWLQQVQHPAHMHHAARYTALGDDLEYRRLLPSYEREGREEAFKQLKPRLHVNLHGYPSHEWCRPLSGYVPPGFEAWTLPKGFCLIFRFQLGLRGVAEDLAHFVARALARVPGLLTMNREQCATFEAHTSARPYQMRRGTPCLFVEKAELDCPLVLITEFPDETVRGADFLLGQQAQLAVIQAASMWLRTPGIIAP